MPSPTRLAIWTFPPVVLDRILDDGQTQAGPLDVLAVGAARAIETLKYVRKVLLPGCPGRGR